MAVIQCGKHWLWLVLSICSVAAPAYSQTPNLNVIFEWSHLEFDYESPSDRAQDVRSGIFKPETAAPTDMDMYHSPTTKKTEVFVSIPRFLDGRPVTLGTVTQNKLNGNPIIKPYPDWSWHRNPEKCHKNRLVSVFRTKIDKCGRLWVADSGRIVDDQLCAPQIIAFDLNTNEVLYRHELPPESQNPNNVLVTLVVDIREGCQDTFVYVADSEGFTLIVYDVARDKSWKIRDGTFYPYPNHRNLTIAGESFIAMDGILGMALTPYVPGKDRALFYHSLASVNENFVFTADIRNFSLFESDASGAPQIFTTFPGERMSQSLAEDIDKDAIMIFGLLRESHIVCWNTGTDYSSENFAIIANDSETLQFPTGIKITLNKQGEQELWILSARLQKLATGSLNPNEINFRIHVGKIDDLLNGTKCREKPQN